MSNLSKYQGVFPAFYACYDEQGNISIERTRAFAAYLIKEGVNGVEFLAHFGVAKTTDMTAKQYGEAVKWLEEMGEQNEMG